MAKMKTITSMIEHQLWANAEITRRLQLGELDDAGQLRLLRHMAIAEQVWLLRLQGKGTLHLQLWEDGDAGETLRLMQANAQGYRLYMEQLTEEELERIVNYTNQQGQPFQTPVRDILLQVALHGQYHRGQLNRRIVELGEKPAVFDYIVYARS